MSELKSFIEATEKIEPITEVNGVKVVEPAQQRDLAVMEKMMPQGLGTVRMNPDGTVARTPVKYAAVNPESYFNNRFKKVKDSVYVVVDERALQEQQSGVIYAKQIRAYVIARDDKGKLKLVKTATISDTEFVSDFVDQLGREDMEQILPLIKEGVEVTKSSLPI